MKSMLYKWLAGGVFSLVVSLPFLVPAWNPMNHHSDKAGTSQSKTQLKMDSVLGLSMASVINPYVEVANDRAFAESRPTTLQDVLTLAAGVQITAQPGMTAPTFKLNGNQIDVVFTVATVPVQCTITIDGNDRAVAQC